MLPRGGEAACDVVEADSAGGGEGRSGWDESRPSNVDIAWSEGKGGFGTGKSATRGCGGCLWRGWATTSIEAISTEVGASEATGTCIDIGRAA